MCKTSSCSQVEVRKALKVILPVASQWCPSPLCTTTSVTSNPVKYVCSQQVILVCHIVMKKNEAVLILLLHIEAVLK